MIPPNIDGRGYVHLLCEDCKAKLIEKTTSINKGSFFNKLKMLSLAKEFPKILCEDCKKKIVEEMRKKGVLR